MQRRTCRGTLWVGYGMYYRSKGNSTCGSSTCGDVFCGCSFWVQCSSGIVVEQWGSNRCSSTWVELVGWWVCGFVVRMCRFWVRGTQVQVVGSQYVVRMVMFLVQFLGCNVVVWQFGIVIVGLGILVHVVMFQGVVFRIILQYLGAVMQDQGLSTWGEVVVV